MRVSALGTQSILPSPEEYLRRAPGYISVRQAPASLPSNAWGNRVEAILCGEDAASKVGPLWEGKRKYKDILKTDGVWKRKCVWQQEGQITGGGKKAVKEKQPKEVVIKCKAEDFQGIFQLRQESGLWTILPKCVNTVLHFCYLLKVFH